ncbi:MAG: DUF3426 domain-containing protein [Rudaea sp.]
MTAFTYTRCPGCATVFRVTAEQLALREGQVRCGHCRAVFDANDHVVAREAPPAAGEGTPQRPATPAPGPAHETPATDARPPADITLAAPPEVAEKTAYGGAAEAVTEALHEAQDRSSATEPAPVGAAPAEAVSEAFGAAAHGEGAAPDATADRAPTEPPPGESDAAALPDRPVRYEWKPREPLREQPKALYAVATVVLMLALALQAVYGYRGLLAAHAPFTRPLLQAACDLLGCVIEPLRDAAALSIEGSDLRADPAHRGLLLLTATLRNRAAYAIAYPHLELTLTDASDRVVARRAFAPGEYVGGTADPGTGIPGNGEQVVKLFLDASSTSQAGYRLYLFYP